VRRIVVLTHRQPAEILPALNALALDVKTEPPTPDTIDRLTDLEPDVLLADALEDPERIFGLLSSPGAAAVRIPRVALLRRTDLERLPWPRCVEDIVFADATPEELRLRFALARGRVPEDTAELIRAGPISINPETYQVTIAGRTLDLTYKEFELLRFLAATPGRVHTRVALLREVWGYDFYGGTRTVDVHIRRLRAKLGPEHEHLIETVRGVGYRAASG